MGQGAKERYVYDLGCDIPLLINVAPNNKKLALIYLANEVVQQSRAKKRDEFISAFANIIPGALGSAYKQCSNEIRAKIKRVVEVWRQRSIFTEGVLYKIEGQLHGMLTVLS